MKVGLQPTLRVFAAVLRGGPEVRERGAYFLLTGSEMPVQDLFAGREAVVEVQGLDL